jgi:hypothetical protein
LKSSFEILRKIVEDFIRDQRTMNRLIRSDISDLEEKINRLETNVNYKERISEIERNLKLLTKDQEEKAISWLSNQQEIYTREYYSTVGGKRKKPKNKRDIEEALLIKLIRKGKENVQRQVVCEGGKIDLMTEDSIYEIKYRLSRDSIQKAIGLLLTYHEYYPEKQMIMTGIESIDTKSFVPILKKVNIKLEIWGPENWEKEIDNR